MVMTETRRSLRADGAARIKEFRKLLTSKNQALLEHRYFRSCRSGELSPEHLLEVVKQLYCFSVFFERLLTRRITEYSSDRDQRILDLARIHLRDEIGHATLFHDCLTRNGVSSAEIASITPKLFTKAMFGYLSTTLQHENEYVANVAIMQVMESIGYHFFSETLSMMKVHDMAADALVRHTEDDEHHPELGIELVASFDDTTLEHSVRVINDLYRLMAFVLDEWLGLQPASGSIPRSSSIPRSGSIPRSSTPARKRRSVRPRAN
jgi:thiaminase